jgi:hypothetical protein
MHTQSIATRAAIKGFTVAVFIEAGMSDLEGFAKPGTDYDDRFTIICGDTGDTLRVNGWNCLVHEGEDA